MHDLNVLGDVALKGCGICRKEVQGPVLSFCMDWLAVGQADELTHDLQLRDICGTDEPKHE